MDISALHGFLRTDSPRPSSPARFTFVSIEYGPDDQKALILYESDPRVYDSGNQITLSYHRNQDDSASLENKLLDSRGNKDEIVMDVFVDIFPRIPRLYDTVTAVSIQTIDHELAVTVREDLDEIIHYLPIPDYLAHIPTVPLSQLDRITTVALDVDRVKWQSHTYAFKRTVESLHGTLRELSILHKLSTSPYIIDLKAIVVDPHNSIRGFLMPFMRIGDLQHVFRTLRSRLDTPNDSTVLLDWPVKLSWARQITNAVVDLHAISAFNGDLKPQNVLLDPTGRAVLIDFLPIGISEGYAAPEVLEKSHTDAPFESILTASADIYSLGLLLWAVSEENWRAMRPPVWRDATPTWYRDVVRRCLVDDPEMRPSAAEVLSQLVKEGP